MMRHASVLRSLVRATAASIVLVCAACSGAPSDRAAEDDANLNVDQAPIMIGLTELKAGQAYLPGVNEVPLTIGAGSCITGPKVTLTGGEVTATATVVQSRTTIGRELGLDLAAIPIRLGGATALTASAGLALNTTFDQDSATVLFQTSGKYESVMTGADSMAPFDSTKVSQCGYGYIARATHRLGAALVVSVRSTDKSRSVKADGGVGGGVDAKAHLANLIDHGNLELSLRFAADAIPSLPPAPFGSLVLVVGGHPGDPAALKAEQDQAKEKLDSALTWLASAESAISMYMLGLRTNPDAAPPAPTQDVSFRFYSGTPSSVRNAVSQAAVKAADVRRALASAIALEGAWTTFAKDAAEGRGVRWNIPKHPATTVDDLIAKQHSLLDGGAASLKPYEDALGAHLDACTDAFRNEAAKDTPALLDALQTACTPAAAPPFAPDAFDVRPIAAVSFGDAKPADRACPNGQRLPLQSEQAIFLPWARAYGQQSSHGGVWTADGSCTFGAPWLVEGGTGCVSNLRSTTVGLRICMAKDGGPLPSP